MVDVRAVVFDLFGTLSVDQIPEDRHSRQAVVADTLGIPVDAFITALRATFAQRATGSWGSAEEALARLCRSLGRQPSAESLRTAVRLRRDAERWLARPRLGALELLTRLRAAHVPIGVLSDCTDELVTVWSLLPYRELVDDAVFSARMGVRKPDPWMYGEIARRLSIPCDTVIYVGDGGSNELTGAARVGMRPVLLRESLDEPESTSQLRYDAELDWRGEHVRDMTTLTHLLKRCGVLPIK